MKILLVEDEKGLILTLTDRLTAEGYEVVSAADGEAGFRSATSDNFDLIILDIMLPKRTATTFAGPSPPRGRNAGADADGKGETIDKVLGLKLGADDYLTSLSRSQNCWPGLSLDEAVAKREGSDKRCGGVWQCDHRSRSCRGPAKRRTGRAFGDGVQAFAFFGREPRCGPFAG